MISSGIFILPSLAFGLSGPAVTLAYILAGLLAFCGTQSIIELATAMPKAGGDYYFINRSLGPAVGTFSGILGWTALSLKSAFAVYGISEVLYILFDFPPLITGSIIIFLFVVLNIAGAKEAAAFQSILVVLLVSILIFFIITGIPKVDLNKFQPFCPMGIKNVIYTSAFVFISFGGLLKIANMSEEVKNPGKNIPKGIKWSIIVATILYTLTVFVVTGILSPSVFIASGEPVADAAGFAIGKFGIVIVTVGAMLAFITTANAGIMAASRYPLSMGRDRLIPEIFSSVNKRGMPAFSIIFTGIVMFVSLLFPLAEMVKVASSVILTSYIMTNLSVIIFRESGLMNYRPVYKTKMYPWLQIFCIAVFTYFVFILGSGSALLSVSFIILSLLVYLFYGRKRYQGDAAVLHVIERIAGKDITDGLLEKELEDIIRNREDEIFKQIFLSSDVIEAEEHMTFTSILKKVAPSIGKKSGLSEQEVITKFLQREAEMTTVLTPYIAVPHIITEPGTPMFLAMIRSQQGIEFASDAQNVKAVFCTGGPVDKRNQHIKLLSSIVRGVSEEGFLQKWETSSPKELKELFNFATVL